MKKILILPTLLLGLTLGLISGDHGPDSQAKDAMLQISRAEVREYIYALASDSLEGRETGFKGQRHAARYLAGLFAHLGLKPIGDSGTYLQNYPVTRSTVDSASSLSVKTSRSARTWSDFGIDYLPFGSGKDSTVSGPVVFAGYGISSFALHFDEYDTSIDYHGKILLVLRGGPRSDDSTARFFRFRNALGALAKRAYAEKHGAAALLVVEDTHEHSFDEFTRQRKDDVVRGVVTVPSQVRPGLPTFEITRVIANEILSGSGTTIEQLADRIDSSMKPATYIIPNASVTVNLRIHSRLVAAQNVVGLLDGSDPVLKNEYVVFSAHYDHLGKNAATGEIYYGADDNASGTTSVLAIAGAFAHASARPRRSLIFLIVSGEEKGLLGSTYYVDHPVIPLEQTVADLNIDMVGRIDPAHEARHDSNYVYVIGSDRLSSELDAMSKAADSESVSMSLDYTYDSENDPNQFYRRSDHYNFAKHNIPIIFYFNGTHADYHEPTDRPEKIDFPLLARRAQLVFFTGWKVANAPHRPIIDRGAGTKSAGGSE